MDGKPDMKGKVCLITGATSGIGRATAQALAAMGATTVLLGRSTEKCLLTVDTIRKQTGNADVQFLAADLSSQADIRMVTEKFREQYKRLDVLINNAGGLFWQEGKSIDGIEMTFALNHLAPFLLTHELLNMLKSTASARIVTVASVAHRMSPFNLDIAMQSYGIRGYGMSKFCNILFTYTLSRQLAGTSVTANTLHPGVVATNFGKSPTVLGTVTSATFRIIGISPEKGAETSVYLASSPEVAHVSGKYFTKKKAVPSSEDTYNVSLQEALWVKSAELVRI